MYMYNVVYKHTGKKKKKKKSASDRLKYFSYLPRKKKLNISRRKLMRNLFSGKTKTRGRSP